MSFLLMSKIVKDMHLAAKQGGAETGTLERDSTHS